MTGGIYHGLLACVLIGLLVIPASAGRLVSLDPRVRAASGPAAPGSVKPLSVPKAFLERDLLLSSTVIATDSPKVILGVSQVPVEVRPKLDGATLSWNRVRAPIGGDPSQAGAPLAAWPAADSGDAVELTPEHPLEVFTLDGTTYHADRPTTTQDAVVEADRFAVTLRYEAAAVGTPLADDPPNVELAVRLTVFFRAAPARPGKPYTEADDRVAGLFTLGLYESGRPGAEGDLAIRPDPAQPLRFVLHPSVPEMARDVVREALLTWNPALERAVGAKLVTVEDGTDATLMPGTPGVVVVYWFGGDVVEKFMGYTQALADPRNGEIIGGQILLSEQQLTGEGALQALIDDAIVSAYRPSRTRDPRTRGMAAAMPAPMTSMGGTPDDVLMWTVVHEAGHLLGLRHNFRASTDEAKFAQGQHSTSCMDYLPTPLAPRAPLAYDEFALAFGQGKPAPAGSEGPFRFASDEMLLTDPDCNQYDAGDPLAWAKGYIKSLRSTRNELAEAQKPDVSAGLMFTCLGGTAKIAVSPSDPRRADALRFMLSLLSDQGADPALGGGLDGRTEGDATPEQMRAKNLPDRRAATAHFLQLVASGRLPATERDLFLRTLARTALDQSRTDLYAARMFALKTMAKVQGEDARTMLWTLLKSMQRELTGSAKATATRAQDIEIFKKGRALLYEAAKK